MAREEEGPTGSEDEELIQEMMFHKRRCCFCIPCFKSDRSNGSGSPWWGRIRSTTNSESPSNNEEKWWSKSWMKVREWSELMAGPKWKTFIRRFNKNGRCGKQGKFHYDPLSYALNFDEGPTHDALPDDDLVFRDFSSRYASIPISAKSSMDLGKDGPSFI